MLKTKDLLMENKLGGILWGAGKTGVMIEKMLKAMGLNDIIFTDSNISLWGDTIGDYEVLPNVDIMANIKEYNRNYVVIVCIAHPAENTLIKALGKYINVVSWMDVIEVFTNYIRDKEVGYTANYIKGLKTWWMGLKSEIAFWENAYARKEGYKHSWYLNLVKNDIFYDRYLSVDVPQNAIVLDVGSGIVSRYGEIVGENKKIHLTAVDPLAGWYNLFNLKYCPEYSGKPVQFGLFENLSNVFENELADLIIISNALDHCIDPYLCIIEALHVLKIGGVLYVKSFRRESCNEKCMGLHQWNIDIEGEDFIIWNLRNYINVSRELKGYCSIDIKVYEEDERGLKGNWGFLTIEIKKRKNISNQNKTPMLKKYSDMCEKSMKRILERDYNEENLWEEEWKNIESEIEKEYI